MSKRAKRPRTYQPTDHERTAIQAFFDAQTKNSPRIIVSESDGRQEISNSHEHTLIGYILLMEALGTSDRDFLGGLLGQIADIGSEGRKTSEKGINFVLSIIKGIGPKDQVETMLAAQMAAIHLATMTFARRLAHVETIPQQDSAERALNKLARTFAAQVEALKRYRSGGEQKITVQHVNVTKGGQAIVGNVTQTQREAAPDKNAPAAPALTHQRVIPMPTIGERRERVAFAKRRSKK